LLCGVCGRRPRRAISDHADLRALAAH
jgi:hypothetical protein